MGEPTIRYLRVDALDNNAYPLDTHFAEAAEFMHQAERVLVHCHSGHSRSATLVLMFLVHTASRIDDRV